jgi:hypothetical protein
MYNSQIHLSRELHENNGFTVCKPPNLLSHVSYEPSTLYIGVCYLHWDNSSRTRRGIGQGDKGLGQKPEMYGPEVKDREQGQDVWAMEQGSEAGDRSLKAGETKAWRQETGALRQGP